MILCQLRHMTKLVTICILYFYLEFLLFKYFDVEDPRAGCFCYTQWGILWYIIAPTLIIICISYFNLKFLLFKYFDVEYLRAGCFCHTQSGIWWYIIAPTSPLLMQWPTDQTGPPMVIGQITPYMKDEQRFREKSMKKASAAISKSYNLWINDQQTRLDG